jgi:septum formation protein
MSLPIHYPGIDIFEKAQVVLSSGSPRRRELLGRLLPPEKFTVVVSEVDELQQQDEEYTTYVTRLALSKAKAGALLWYERGGKGRAISVGADTIVVLDGGVFGKPADNEDAKRMLRQLSGRTHRVITGFCAALLEETGTFARTDVSYTTSEVEFKALSETEINWYVDTGEPSDKAGAYAIQGYGGPLITAVRGDYYNVVGLPLAPLVDMLRKF